MFRVSTAFYSLTRKGNKYAIFLILIYQFFATNSNFLILISLLSDGKKLRLRIKQNS